VQAKQHRLDFVAMMSESDTLSSTMRWSEVTELFEKDSRWEKVEKEARKELYDDFKLELVKREKERKRIARKEKAAAFRKVSEYVYL
jgi:pre-mRNA-processing factor 40